MRNTWTIARRELGSYFSSPIAYLITAAFLVVAGYLFSLILFYSRQATLSYMMFNVTTILLLIGPALSMRLIAEERHTGSIELLLSAPVQDWQVVVGKYLSAFVLWAGMLAMTGYYSLVLKLFSAPDWGPIATGYLGLLLIGGALLAVGTLASTLTSNQIVAAVLGFAFSMMLWMIDALSGLVGQPFGAVFEYMAMTSHFPDFTKGIIDSSAVTYYVSVIVVALLLATRVLEMRRWK